MARTASIGIRVEPEVKEAAEKAAAADRRTVASLVEKLLVEHLRANGYLADDVVVGAPKPARRPGGGRRGKP